MKNKTTNSVNEKTKKVHDARNDRLPVNIKPGDLIIFDRDICRVYQNGDGTQHLFTIVENWASMPQHSQCVSTAALAQSWKISRREMADIEATQDDFLAGTGRV